MFNQPQNTLKKILISFLLSFLISSSLFSQKILTIPEIEKIYLHTDRSTYVLGESIWYKAYLVNSYTNLLYDHSTILYVELISPDSKIIIRNKIKLIEGLGIGNGDFNLTAEMGIKKPGNYQIRAYTNWTRNFGNEFVFKKEIEIIDVFESRKIASEGKKTTPIEIKEDTKNSIKTSAKRIDVQFFPEGGCLIANIPSVVAFKATDSNGNPIKVQGQVLDANGELITMFVSIHDGMGKFQLNPIKGMQYHAKITDENNSEIIIPFPKVREQGYLLSYKQIKDQDILTVKTNPGTLLKLPNANLTIQYTTRGITHFKESIALTNNSVSIALPKDSIPEGICQITLVDSDFRPQSERLVYIKKTEDVKVEMTTNKTKYAPREKVIVHVSSKNNLGETVPASYSIASVDLNGVKEEKNYNSNISSYFLMESDIRGKINQAGYYFDSSNPNRFTHLDLLLLTQGWRDFLWKQLPEVKADTEYKVEKGIQITGRVKQLIGTKPITGNDVSLAVFNKSLEIFKETTNDAGEFRFNNLTITGKARIMLNTKNKSGTNKGMFVLDSIFKSPIDVDFKGNTINSEPSSEINTISNTIYKKRIAFDVLPENVLEEVKIVSVKKAPLDKTNIHNKFFKSYVVGEDVSMFTDIFSLLEYAVPTLESGNREVIKFSRNNGGALIVINQTRILDPADGSVIDYIQSIQPDDVLSIESDNSTISSMMFGEKGKNGSIMIYLKSNSDYAAKSTRNDPSSIKQQIEGYYEARVFYAPNLDASDSKPDKVEEIRNTLYWNPYVQPDKTGVRQMDYYNSAIETNVKLTLEGMTATGIPVVVKTYYTIEK